MGEEIPVANPFLNLMVKKLPEIPDRKMSRHENECKICGIPFSKTGSSQTQRHVCRFCYHAVCASCSPLTAIHPETNNSERICLVCYTHYLRIHIEDENAPKTQEKIKTQVEDFQRCSLDLHLIEIEKIKNESKDKEKNYHDQISRLSLEIQERDSRIMTMNFEAEKQNNNNSQSVSSYLNERKKLEDENNRLKKELGDLKNRPPPKVEEKSCMKCSII